MSAAAGDIYVLHVDDEPDFAELVAEYLTRIDDNISVDTAPSASKGLDYLGRYDYDCVVSDYDMPGLDGIEFLQAVQRRVPNLPFILYTGKGSEEIASEAISSGVTDYLQKASGSSQYEVLANRIKNAVGQFRTRRQLDRNQDLLEHTEQVADIGGWEADLETGEVHWTDGTYAVHDLQADSSFVPSIDTAVEFFHPEDRDEIERLLERCAQAGEPYDVELRIRTAEDRLRWVRTTGEAVRDSGDIVTLRGAIQDITDRKEREAQLEQERTQLNALFEYSTDAIAFGETVDGEPIVRDVNAAFAETFGYDKESAVDRPIDELVVPDESGKMKEATDLNRRIIAGERVVTEVRRQTVDGIKDFILQATPLDPGVSGTRTYVIYRDVTDRKERERELQAQQADLQLYERAIEGATDLLAATDSEYNLLFANEQYRDYFGLSKEAIGQIMLPQYLGDDWESKIKPRIDRTLAGEEVSYQLEREGPAGNHRELDIRYYPLIIDDSVVGAVTAMRDVTDQTEKERKLRDRTRQLEAVLDSVKAAIWIRDLDSRFQLVTQNFRDLFGIDPSMDIVGKHPSELLDEEIATQFLANDRQVISTEQLLEIEEEVETEHGRRTYLTRIKPLFDDDGELFATCGVASNITAQKEQERKLTRQNERLNEFARVISHDLRNPLTVAQGRLELATNEYDGDHLDDVGRALDRMGTLIDDTLSLAKAGVSVGETEAVEVAALVETCWRDMETQAAQYVVETDIVIQADKSRLRQLFENVLRNAVQHGGPNVTITVGGCPDGFFIEDDGAGIAAEDKDSVLDIGHTTSVSGTGFGLNIVRDIAHAHDWAIEITESETGGARFEFTGVDTA